MSETDGRVPRLILDASLTEEEADAALERAWMEQFGKGPGGSIHEFIFLAHHYQGETKLEKAGQLTLFRKTQRLPDYPKAEASVKRRWQIWAEQEFGIGESKGRDKLKIRQCLLLLQLRGSNHEMQAKILREASKLCHISADQADQAFFIRLGRALGDSQTATHGSNDFAQALLHNWLTSFFWLMPPKAVAQQIARIQAKGSDSRAINNYYERLRKIKTRRGAAKPGCLYSAHPPLIDCIEKTGDPVFTTVGRRLLV